MAPVEVILSDYNCPGDCVEVSARDWYRVVASRKTQQSAPNNRLPTPTNHKLTIPGTNYCGPGGNGTPTNNVDAACATHDACLPKCRSLVAEQCSVWAVHECCSERSNSGLRCQPLPDTQQHVVALIG